MFDRIVLFGRLDEGVTGPSSFGAGAASENTEDEAQILGDQDETSSGIPNEVDEVMGGMGTADEFGLESGAFARGEIDLKEQMERTTRAFDRATHRDPDALESAAPVDPEGNVDTIAARSDGLNNRKPGEDEKSMRPARGHETGAFTDIGAGRSGVTKTHH